MERYTTCAFLIAILVASPIALGEIIPDFDCDGEGSDWGTMGSCFANGYAPQDSLWGNGYQRYYTTQAGIFSWSYTVYAKGYAEITLYNGDYCQASAYGVAVASGPGFGDSYEAIAGVSGSGSSGTRYEDDDPEPEEPAGASDSSDDWPFEASEGISAAHYASAWAEAVAGHSSNAYASIETVAYCGMN